MRILQERITLDRLEEEFNYSELSEDNKKFAIYKGLIKNLTYELAMELQKNLTYVENLDNKAYSGNPFESNGVFSKAFPIKYFESKLYILTEEEFFKLQPKGLICN